MGLYLRHVKAMLLTYPEALNLKKTITIGRQYLFAPPAEIVDYLRSTNRATGLSQSNIDTFLKADNFYVDNLLRLLGAEKIDSMDYSDYEQASIIHDLNKPIEASLKNQYSLVLDIGTIEHVFNAPVAMKALMEMVEQGGKLIISTTGNNQPGHGFYQFSPEFFFRTLTEENGYRIDSIFVQECFEGGRTYEIRDPLQMRKRATYCSWAEMDITVIATRIAVKPIFEETPQQSDYVIAWKGEEKGYVHQTKVTMKTRIKDFVNRWFPSLMHKYYCKRCQPGALTEVYKQMKL